MILLLALHSLSFPLERDTQNFTVLYTAVLSVGNTTTAFSCERLVLALLGLVLIAAAVVAIERLINSRHSHSIKRKAQELGLAFSPDGKPFEGSDVHGLVLLQGNPSVEAKNVVRAEIDGKTALVLELPCFEVYEAETPHQHFTTVAAFRCPGGNVPEFELGRKSLVSKFGDVLWRQPAVVDDREFAKEFYVHCHEPQKVHDWLTPAKLAKLQPTVLPFHINANAGWILIFRPGEQLPAAQLPAFLRETSGIVAALLQ